MEKVPALPRPTSRQVAPIRKTVATCSPVIRKLLKTCLKHKCDAYHSYAGTFAGR
jgi:hypothetical protein